jgi:3-phenylpropionate/trans-cinnamate dioxygenase ferredoxin reductase subunit
LIDQLEKMMKKTKYLIIGGGMAADSAVRGIRSIDQEASISLISNESVPPYNRPPLSKGLWEGKSIEKIWRHTEKQHVDISLDTEIVNLDLSGKSVSDNLGNEILFEKVLLVTGTSPRKFPFGGDSINYLRYLKDFENLKLVVDQKDRFTVIGGGFIGSEIAASLSLLGKRVTIIFPERWMMSGISVTGFEEQGEEKIVHLNTKEGISQNLISDGVIAGLGVIPNTKLAQDAGLAVENGIRVNSHFQTENAYVFSAGDVANYPDYYLKKNRRVEHEDHANMSGMLAGKNMTCAGHSYEYLPYFYSDLYDIGYEAVGELDSSFDVIIDWEEPFKKGTLYYQRELKIVGVLFWNNWGKLDKAREIILKGKNFSKNDLFGLIR